MWWSLEIAEWHSFSAHMSTCAAGRSDDAWRMAAGGDACARGPEGREVCRRAHVYRRVQPRAVQRVRKQGREQAIKETRSKHLQEAACTRAPHTCAARVLHVCVRCKRFLAGGVAGGTR